MRFIDLMIKNLVKNKKILLLKLYENCKHFLFLFFFLSDFQLSLLYYIFIIRNKEELTLEN